MPEPTAEPAPTPEPEKPQERAFSLAVNAVPLVSLFLSKSQPRGLCRWPRPLIRR